LLTFAFWLIMKCGPLTAELADGGSFKFFEGHFSFATGAIGNSAHGSKCIQVPK
jgi:hypothetical protein